MKWNSRSFFSFLLALSFVVIMVSGIVLYIAPHGRVAYWVNWRLFGLTKDGWAAIHTIIGYLFMIVAVAHFVLNFRVFAGYLKKTVQAGQKHLWELVASVVLFLLIFGATISNVPPFSTTMEIGEYFKESWAVESEKIPIPHSELMTIAKFSEKLDLPIESVMKSLNEHGIQVEDTNETLKSIADRNDVSPSDVYKIMQPQRGGGRGLMRDGGRGLMRGRGRGNRI